MISLQNLDREHAFSDADVRLLTTLAGSLSVALENARLFEEIRQRNAELALINDVQPRPRRTSSRCRRCTSSSATGSRRSSTPRSSTSGIFDADAGPMHVPVLDRARRARSEHDADRGDGVPEDRARDARARCVINEDIEAGSAAIGQPIVVVRRAAQVDVVRAAASSASEAVGVISLQNLDREHAFSDADVRLLTTLAGEPERRAGERAARSRRRASAAASSRSSTRCSAGSRSTSDLRRPTISWATSCETTFGADIVYVALHDRATSMIDFPYYIERGERRRRAPMQFGPGPDLADPARREPLLLNRGRAVRARRTRQGVGTAGESYLGVPIIVGDDAIGVDRRPEHRSRTGASATRTSACSSTIAANVGAAIQNARLYREAQRRRRETEALDERRAGGLGHAGPRR